MKKSGFWILFFLLCLPLEAKVVCKTPSDTGNEATEAGNIQQECNEDSTGSVQVSDRDVNVQQIANVLTSDQVSSKGESSKSGGASGATR